MKLYMMSAVVVAMVGWCGGQEAIAPAEAAATTQAAVDAPPLEQKVAELEAEVERLKRENQALQETVDGLRTNAGPAWVSQEKFNALRLELEHEKALVAVLRAEVEELRKRGPATQPIDAVP